MTKANQIIGGSEAFRKYAEAATEQGYRPGSGSWWEALRRERMKGKNYFPITV